MFDRSTITAVAITAAVALHAAEPRFIRGDANADNLVNITDTLVVLEFIFQRGPTPPCADAADADDNGRINVSDAIVLLHYLFSGGAEIPPPSPFCGLDPSNDDGLGCLEPPEAAPECRDRSAVVAWDAPAKNEDGTDLTDLAGYVVHHAMDPDALAESGIDVGMALEHRFEDLEPGPHYFAVSAYDEAGNRSGLSAVVSKTIR